MANEELLGIAQEVAGSISGMVSLRKTPLTHEHIAYLKHQIAKLASAIRDAEGAQ